MLCNAGWLQETAPGVHLPALPHPKSQTSIIRRNIKPPDTTWQSLICSTQASHMFPLELTPQLQMKSFMVKAFVFSHVGLQLSYAYIYISLFSVSIQTTHNEQRHTTKHGSHATMRIGRKKNKWSCIAVVLAECCYTTIGACKNVRRYAVHDWTVFF